MTRWEKDQVDAYEAWFHTRAGSFALDQERRLIDRLISRWPRRGQNLLELGCGPGLFLEHFWKSGFDVTGIDACTAMVEAAARRLGSRAELRIGSAERLPFQDNEFDFAAVITVLEFCDDPLALLREAARVARKGMLVAYLNRFSLYYLARGSGTLAQARWFSCFEMRKLLREAVGPWPSHSMGVLLGPPFSWRKLPGCKQLNSMLTSPLFASFVATRVDFLDEKPLTPLLAFKAEPRLG